jgi:hypothetical protein
MPFGINRLPSFAVEAPDCGYFAVLHRYVRAVARRSGTIYNSTVLNQ